MLESIEYDAEKKLELKRQTLMLTGYDFDKRTDLSYNFYRKNYKSIFQNDLEDSPNDSDLEKEKFPIEYFVLNMPKTIAGENPHDFVRILKQVGRIELFEKLQVQIVLDYKWDQYCFGYFFNQFSIYVMFLVFFIADTYVTQIMGKTT